MLNGVDKPARLPLCAHCVDKSRYSFALTSMSLSDFPLQKEVDKPTRLLQFVAFEHLPFSFRSLDLFVASLLFMKGTSFCVIKRK